MTRLILVLLICLFIWKCSASLPVRKASTASIQILFVPGYYGSTLIRETDGRKVWFTGAEALWGNQTLALDREGLDIPGATPLKVGDVLRSVNFLSPVISKDIYGRIIDGLNTRFAGQAHVIPFAYDWRDDIPQSAQKLAQRVEDLYAAGASKVAILAHSMGGLVTSYYLLYGNQKLEAARMDLSGARRINAVAMAGVPFKGTQAVFRNMQHGIRFGLNSKALEGLAVASFPSSYQILPTHPLALTTLQGEDISDWIHNMKHWREGNWSLLKNTGALDPATRQKREAYTHSMLLRAETFYKRIHAASKNAKSDLPFLLMYGDAIPTVRGSLWDEKENTLLFSGKNLKTTLKNFDARQLQSPGDGTVTVSSAQPPEIFAPIFPGLKIIAKKQEHLEMLRDEMNQNEITEFMKEALELPLNIWEKKIN
ncbi:MAG: hypothetical protein NPINA01_32730 [Nitrospinaceae bacterium]|nr:MAG: hypothetical protein NPINA01_32730 [Nitrospinaceae bacterium]